MILYLLVAAGAPVMHAAVTGMMIVGALLSWARPDLRGAGLRGAVGFGAFYLIALLAAFATWPHLPGQWAADGVAGVRVLSVPSGEIAWALVYGWVYPSLFGCVTSSRSPGRQSLPVRLAFRIAAQAGSEPHR